jgi:hypothetical protein
VLCLPYVRLPKFAPLHIQPEDGNCSISRNVGKNSTFDAAHIRKPKLYVELYPRKSKDKNVLRFFPFL